MSNRITTRQHRSYHAIGRRISRRPAPAPDAGAVALTLALFMVALLAMAGLVIDGGASLAARAQAHDLADQAARAGADALSPQSLRAQTPQELRIDPDAARTAALSFLRAADATGTITIGQHDVSVTAHVQRQAVILSAFGLHDMSATATSSATIVHGTTQGRP
jgi:Flp pilus assembly protein TadG